MAKIAYSKLGLNKFVNKEPVTIGFNDQSIEVIQYLPIEKKLDLISNIINKSIDKNNYYNSCRVEIYILVEIILTYTNLNITDKQKEDVFKLYDSFVASGFADKVIDAMPEKDYIFIYNNTFKIIKNIYKQRNSVLGILDTISSDYSTLDFDATEIQKKLSDPESMEFLKSVLSKLG